ncbi:uncharacterized protein DUF4625 [Marinilabilia salmonicolor]|jgi:hypothetical protein|uniref:DUF4625 domain-containing protein n=1 Tax=Marinilabilia salmonicolor TaxID=989 RepID=UPI000D04E46A|nr:DUF4625 domain-containing protein [Marinilabilia salmonicolor]PRY98315.1 uncharacterized protein DUF4625 [Marinilabilia salmonicolor]
MKMNRLNPLLFLMTFMVSFGFVACGGDDDDNKEEPVDTENPVIVITTPEENGSYSKTARDFFISGEFTDNVALDSCTFSLSILKSIDDEPWSSDPVGISITTGDSYSFNEEYFGKIPGDSKEGIYTLTVELIDAAGNTAPVKTISFNITE